MRWLLGSGLALFAGAAWGEGWQKLDGIGINNALVNRVLRYEDGTEQEFLAGGITQYTHGWLNEGRWKIEGDSYCSLWPPGTGWTCFVVEEDPDLGRLRFRGADGRVTEGFVAGKVQGP